MDEFQKAIKEYLDSINDELFKAKYDSTKIEDCCKWIIEQVEKTGRNGFADDEIYKLARDYFNDSKESTSKDIHCEVVVNHPIELSEEEKEKAREEAIEEYKQKELEKLQAKEKKEQEKITKAIVKEKEKAKEKGQSFFDLFGD